MSNQETGMQSMKTFRVYGRRGDELSEEVHAESEVEAIDAYNGARYAGTEEAAYAKLID